MNYLAKVASIFLLLLLVNYTVCEVYFQFEKCSIALYVNLVCLHAQYQVKCICDLTKSPLLNIYNGHHTISCYIFLCLFIYNILHIIQVLCQGLYKLCMIYTYCLYQIIFKYGDCLLYTLTYLFSLYFKACLIIVAYSHLHSEYYMPLFLLSHTHSLSLNSKWSGQHLEGYCFLHNGLLFDPI